MGDNQTIQLIATLKEVLGELAGKDLSDVDPQATFFELGFDSLLLTQVATLLKRRFQVKITFRQLLEELTTLAAIARYIEEHKPAGNTPATAIEKIATCPVGEPIRPAATTSEAAPSAHNFPATGSSVLERVMKEQMALMARQLEMLNNRPTISAMPRANPPAPAAVPPEAAEAKVTPKAFGPYRPINTKDTAEFTSTQQQALDALMQRYISKTRRSKKQTQDYRSHLADPRSVAGFRTFWKEMVYPIVTERSAGSRFWDVDGNEYIDVTMGFGTNLLGHNPLFIMEAVAGQLKKGVEVGPQSPLTGEVAQLLCELSGHERAAFCNTGSEAVLAAIRLARTVTGRTRIATTGGFHGICDEVLVRANVVNGKRTTVPVAPGIPDHVAREVLVVDYGTQEGLDILKANMDDLAMVLIEPVQSRHPDLQPREFLQELRRLTTEHETVLFFDEVITGFRCHLGGAQAHFGVQADLASWGKVIGGGMPIGALTGAAKYMDALDGGAWNYGDNSFPEVGVTFFAGTYIRHPLAMAASHAILKHLKAQGPGLQVELTARTERFVAELRAFLHIRGVPLHVEQFASMFYLHFGPEIKHGSLLWFYLRDKGIHFWEGRPGFLSTAHTEADVRYLLDAIKASVTEMQAAGFLPGTPGNSADNGRIEFPHSLAASLTTTDNSAPLPERINGPVTTVSAPDTAADATGNKIDFSVYFFGNYPAEYRPDKYELIIDAAKFADENGFKAIWLPERHFHTVGGFSPNPSVLAAALARETRRLHLRAGSVVLPLHHPVRVAEEWAVVDNLSHGRTGISIASGWHPNDFVFAPEAFDRRRELCWEGYDTIQKLWRGEEVEFPTGGKDRLKVKLHPLPKQSRLPAWLTCIHKESFIKAGELGMGVLGYTMNTTLPELAEKIRLYREAFAKHGHDPRHANVTILMHTFVGPDRATAQQTARQPMRDYLRNYLDNSQKRLENQHAQVEVDAADIEYLLDRGFEDYLNGKALIGSPADCAATVEKIREMGVDEIGCFLDFGIDPAIVRAQLPWLAELKKKCNSSAQSADDGQSTSTPRHALPLPEAQQGLVTIAALGTEATRAYTEANTLELRGELNLPALRRALQRCVHRHEALRTVLDASGETQTVLTQATLDVALEDLSAQPAHEQAARKDELFKTLEAKSFDLHHAPVMAAQVIKLAADQHLLVLLFHHTLGNGPAYWIFMEDFCAFYESEATGTAFAKPAPMQFSQFVDWRGQHSKTEEYQLAKKFWKEQFADGIPQLDLPTDRPRPLLKTFRGARGARRLDAALTQAMRKTGAAQRCSLYMFLLTGFKVLLHRLSGQSDLVLGTPFDSDVRAQPGGEGLFANTTNMTLVRSRLRSEAKFDELLTTTKNQILECQEHQDYFFGNLLKELKIQPSSNRAGLFTVGFNYEAGSFKKNAAGVTVEFLTHKVPYRCPADTAMFDLNLNVAEQDGELLCECDYDTDLFDEATILRLLSQFERLLKAATEQPQQLVSEIPLLSETEQQALVEWNQTRRDYPRELTIHALFQEQAQKYPDKIAVRCGEKTLTYRELDQTANGLAGQLWALGIKAGDRVGIYLQRSVEMVVGVMGILKSGAAYVPMDPAFPAVRLAGMVEDAAMPVIVTHSDLVSKLPSHQSKIVCVDKVQKTSSNKIGGPPAKAEDLAYVIFTSGSTGRPKGVQIQHRAVVNFLNSMRREPGMRSEDVLLSVTTLSFDIAGLELFLPLTTGATLVVATRETMADGNRLRQELEHCGATFMQATPVTWTMLIEAGWPGKPDLKILCGGEAMPPELAQELVPRCASLWNMYGPTETTIWSAIYPVKEARGTISIGRPIDNTQFYIVDEKMQPTPIGIPGELLIGGDGLALGYLKQAELTAEKFIRNPFSPDVSARLYRTGDLARYLADGNIDFLGRMDQQVKLRGFRIELGEIESVLRTHTLVKDCVVVLREDSPGRKRLAGYVSLRTLSAAENNAGDGMLFSRVSDELKSLAATKLPEYMVPSAMVILEELPRTPNGKLDRKALPAPLTDSAAHGQEFIAPRNAREQTLADIWIQVLGLDKVSVLDNFFELGGDSLLSFRVVNRANEHGLPLTSRLLFQHKTIAEIVTALAAGEGKIAVKAATTITRVDRSAFRRSR